jgi:cytochrome P450
LSPDRLDLGRSPNRHLTFASGIHHCIGAPLATVEAQIAFNALVERFPRLRLAAEPEWGRTSGSEACAACPWPGGRGLPARR